jgi:hypothetical protein
MKNYNITQFRIKLSKAENLIDEKMFVKDFASLFVITLLVCLMVLGGSIDHTSDITDQQQLKGLVFSIPFAISLAISILRQILIFVKSSKVNVELAYYLIPVILIGSFSFDITYTIIVGVLNYANPDRGYFSMFTILVLPLALVSLRYIEDKRIRKQYELFTKSFKLKEDDVFLENYTFTREHLMVKFIRFSIILVCLIGTLYILMVQGLNVDSLFGLIYLWIFVAVSYIINTLKLKHKFSLARMIGWIAITVNFIASVSFSLYYNVDFGLIATYFLMLSLIRIEKSFTTTYLRYCYLKV